MIWFKSYVFFVTLRIEEREISLASEIKSFQDKGKTAIELTPGFPINGDLNSLSIFPSG